jgi:hypothetical protein
MSTRTRTQLDDTQMIAAIMEESKEPRLAASVRKSLEKHPASAVMGKRGGSISKTARLRAIMRATWPTALGPAINPTTM